MSSTPAAVASASTLDRLSIYLKTCCRVWIGIYLAFSLLISVKCMMLHVASVGFLLCVLSYFRLPASEPSDVFRILGRDPLNLDGSPSRSISRGVLGLIAHRAAPLDGPENTLEAMKKAKKAGAKSIHCDLTFTSDGVAVAMRPSGLNDLVKGSVKKAASEMTLQETQQFDVAVNHPLKDDFSPSYAPKIEDVSDFVLAEDMKWFIDIALPDKMSLEAVADYVVNELFGKKPGLLKSAIVTSSWPHVVYAIRQKEPRIVSGLVWSPTLLQTTFPRSYSTMIYYLACLGDKLLSWSIHEFLWYFLGLALIVVEKSELNSPYIQKWRSKGIRVIASPVNKSLERLYFEKQLRITCMADTMDEIGVEKLLEDK